MTATLSQSGGLACDNAGALCYNAAVQSCTRTIHRAFCVSLQCCVVETMTNLPSSNQTKDRHRCCFQPAMHPTAARIERFSLFIATVSGKQLLRILPKRTIFKEKKCSFFVLYLSQSNCLGLLLLAHYLKKECTRISHFQKENSIFFWGEAQGVDPPMPNPLWCSIIGLGLTRAS